VLSKHCLLLIQLCFEDHRSLLKLIKKHAIHLIRFCLKSGISENNNIIQFLKENEVILPGRTFDRYKSLAEKELGTDLDANI
jgi:hypothetical protein